MELKPRLRDPNYWTIKTDFLVLKRDQKEYGEMFLNHPIYSPSNYHMEKARIESEWQNNPVKGGCRSLERDLADLFTAYRNVELREVEKRMMVNASFGRIFRYFDEIVSDWEIGYVTEEQMKLHMEEYRNVIQKNKELNLDSWNKQPVIDRIEKTISKVLIQ